MVYHERSAAALSRMVDMVRKSLNQLEQMIMDWYEILKDVPSLGRE